MKEYYDFSLEPGKKLERKDYITKKPEISVIVPFYNDEKYIEQSVNCILNQTYPYFELLIIDDGSKEEKSLKKLEEVSKLDKRIKVFHKENEGLSATRDYGASVSSKDTKYFMFLDSDDLIEKTFLECAYWTLETNTNASWAYSDSVGFDSFTYTWNKLFNSERIKTINDLESSCLIRKEAFYDVNGYEIREKAVNEDWNFWLKLIAKGRYPVHMSYYAKWYRRKEQGELAKANANRKRSLEIINNTAKTIKQKVEAIQYPKQDYNYNIIPDIQDTILIPEKEKDNKINILMIIPWMIVGGADKFNFELIKRLDKEKFNIIIITTECNVNVLRQDFEKYSTVYDLTTFLDQKDWVSFINYIIQKEQINIIFNTNSMYGYSILPYLKAKNPNIPILDYVHMEEWYYRNGGYARSTASCQSVIDKTLVCNKNTEEVIKKHFGKKEEELKTVYIGIDEEIFNPEKYNKEELLKKYNLEKNNKTIISYICRITEQKRPFLLLEIMKKVKEKRDDILFVIAGDGNLFNKLRTEVSKAKLDENVRFLGNISSTQEIYKISDITINCSIKEGLALTSYESLAMGVPVISSNVGGQSELINEEVGKIVPCLQNETDINNFKYSEEEITPYVEAIDEVVGKLKYYKENCRKRILQQFTLNKMTEEMTKIFEESVKNPNEEKIENGKGLSRAIDVTKELICANYASEFGKVAYQVEMYNNAVYNRENYSESISDIHKSNIYHLRFQILREKLWKYPIWRKFVKTRLWKWTSKPAKKVIKKLLKI